MAIFNRVSAAAAMAAALAMGSAPASAAELPKAAHPAGVDVWDGDASTAEGWRYRRYHSRNHIRTGDVVAGVVILGTIAAIANASSNRDRYRDRDYRDRDYRYRDSDYRREDYRTDRRDDRRDMRGDYGARGMERAVDMCVDQVERGDTRVETIDQANRTRDGWAVSGQLREGGSFSCTIDNDGRIRDVDVGNGYAAAPAASGRNYASAGYPSGAEGGEQLSDAAYARARATQGGSDEGFEFPADGPQPQYPGGPVPGADEAPEWQGDASDGAPGSDWQSDGRYDTAEAPDFRQPG